MTRGGDQSKNIGRGKKQGRPKSLIKRVKRNFFIRKDIIDWLVSNKPQNIHIEKAMDAYIKLFKEGLK